MHLPAHGTLLNLALWNNGALFCIYLRFSLLLAFRSTYLLEQLR